jgi:hypothetical protein
MKETTLDKIVGHSIKDKYYKIDSAPQPIEPMYQTVYKAIYKHMKQANLCLNGCII